MYSFIDGEVRLFHLVRLQTDSFGLFLRQQNEQRKNFRFHDEQTENGLRKIAWASVFRSTLQTAAYKCK